MNEKKRLLHRCFPVNFVKFLRTPFLANLILILLKISENITKISIKMKLKLDIMDRELFVITKTLQQYY